MTNIIKILFGVIWFILGCLFTYKAWYIVPVLYSQMPITLLQVLFWVGLLLVWGMIMIIAPVYIILDGFKQEGIIQ